MKERIGQDMTTTKEQFEQVIAICRDLFAKKLKDRVTKMYDKCKDWGEVR